MTTRFQCKNNVNIKRWMTSLKEQQKKKLERAMEEAAREIVQRTQGGREIEGGAFKDYSPEYKDFKMGVVSKNTAKWSRFMKAVKGKHRPPAAGRSGKVEIGRAHV